MRDEEVYSMALKIKGLLERAREDLYINSEPMVQNMIKEGITEEIARKTVELVISPMFKDLDARMKKIEADLEELSSNVMED